jgi:hypothetical protein
MRQAAAERAKTPVWLDLGQLNALLDAGVEAGGDDKREQPLHGACRKIGRARDRRLRAVERAAGK